MSELLQECQPSTAYRQSSFPRPGSFSSFQACVDDGTDDSKPKEGGGSPQFALLCDLLPQDLECCWLGRFIGQMEVFAQLRFTPNGATLSSLKFSVTRQASYWPHCPSGTAACES